MIFTVEPRFDCFACMTKFRSFLRKCQQNRRTGRILHDITNVGTVVRVASGGGNSLATAIVPGIVRAMEWVWVRPEGQHLLRAVLVSCQ